MAASPLGAAGLPEQRPHTPVSWTGYGAGGRDEAPGRASWRLPGAVEGKYHIAFNIRDLDAFAFAKRVICPSAGELLLGSIRHPHGGMHVARDALLALTLDFVRVEVLPPGGRIVDVGGSGARVLDNWRGPYHGLYPQLQDGDSRRLTEAGRLLRTDRPGPCSACTHTLQACTHLGALCDRPNVLLFADSIYYLSPDEVYEAMRKTNAVAAVATHHYLTAPSSRVGTEMRSSLDLDGLWTMEVNGNGTPYRSPYPGWLDYGGARTLGGHLSTKRVQSVEYEGGGVAVTVITRSNSCPVYPPAPADEAIDLLSRHTDIVGRVGQAGRPYNRTVPFKTGVLNICVWSPVSGLDAWTFGSARTKRVWVPHTEVTGLAVKYASTNLDLAETHRAITRDVQKLLVGSRGATNADLVSAFPAMVAAVRVLASGLVVETGAILHENRHLLEAASATAASPRGRRLDLRTSWWDRLRRGGLMGLLWPRTLPCAPAIGPGFPSPSPGPPSARTCPAVTASRGGASPLVPASSLPPSRVPKHWRDIDVTVRVCLREEEPVVRNSHSTAHTVTMGDDDCTVPKLGTAAIGFRVGDYVPIAFTTCSHNMAHACALRHAAPATADYEGPDLAHRWSFTHAPLAGYTRAFWETKRGWRPPPGFCLGYEDVVGTPDRHKALMDADIEAITARDPLARTWVFQLGRAPDPWDASRKWLPGAARWAVVTAAVLAGDPDYPAFASCLAGRFGAALPPDEGTLAHSEFLAGRPAAYKDAYYRVLEDRRGKYYEVGSGMEAAVKNECAWMRVKDHVIIGKPRALQIPRERHTRALGTTIFSKVLLGALPVNEGMFHALHGMDAYAQGEALRAAHVACTDGPEEPWELALDFVCYDGSCQQGFQALILALAKATALTDRDMADGLQEEIDWRVEGLLNGRTIIHGARLPGQQPTIVGMWPASTESGGYLTSSGGTFGAATGIAYARARYIADAAPEKAVLMRAVPFHYFGMGDDVKLTGHWLYHGFEHKLAGYLSELNFTTEIEPHPEGSRGSLLSAFIVPHGSEDTSGVGPDEAWCLVPKVGKVLATSGWTVNACVPADELAYAKYEAMYRMFGWVPILGALARAGLRCLAHVKPCAAASESVQAEYKRKYGTAFVVHTAFASVGTLAAFQQRYGLSAHDVASAEAYLDQASLGVLQHEVLDRVVAHDMFEVGEAARMGGGVAFHGERIESLVDVAGK